MYADCLEYKISFNFSEVKLNSTELKKKGSRIINNCARNKVAQENRRKETAGRKLFQDIKYSNLDLTDANGIPNNKDLLFGH